MERTPSNNSLANGSKSSAEQTTALNPFLPNSKIQHSPMKFEGSAKQHLDFVSPDIDRHSTLMSNNNNSEKHNNYDDSRPKHDPGLNFKKILDTFSPESVINFLSDFEFYKKHDGIRAMVDCLERKMVSFIEFKLNIPDLLTSKYRFDDSLFRSALLSLIPPTPPLLVKKEIAKYQMDPSKNLIYHAENVDTYCYSIITLMNENAVVNGATEMVKVKAVLSGLFPESFREIVSEQEPQTLRELLTVIGQVQVSLVESDVVLKIMSPPTKQSANQASALSAAGVSSAGRSGLSEVTKG